MGAASLGELVTLAEQVVKAQSTDRLTGGCRHMKEPCLQNKRYVFEKLDPTEMCGSCRAFWYSSMALKELEFLASIRSA